METEVTYPQEPENYPNMPPQPQGPKKQRRLLLPLLAITTLAVVTLVAALVVQRLSSSPSTSPTAAPSSIAQTTPDDSSDGEPTAAVPATATATRVSLTPTSTPISAVTPAVSPLPTEFATSAVSPVSTLPSGSADNWTGAASEEGAPARSAFVSGGIVNNGGFETGFEEHSIAYGWETFDNGSAIYEYFEEAWPPAVYDGLRAQQIKVSGASQPDRYGGIYQTVHVVAGTTYDLSLHGQIRTGEGDVDASNYGYRIQLGIDHNGGHDWNQVDEWIDLPWDEQKFDSDDLFFYEHTTQITATDPKLTLYLRTWNKWADPGPVEYTLDEISLTSSSGGSAVIATGEVLISEPLPVTGGDLAFTIPITAVASILVILIMVVGAAWQLRSRSNT